MAICNNFLISLRRDQVALGSVVLLSRDSAAALLTLGHKRGLATWDVLGVLLIRL